MKKIIRSIFAVVLTAAMLTSCGTDSSPEVYDTVTESAISDNTSEASLSDTASASEQLTEEISETTTSETTETTTSTVTETEPVRNENVLTVLSDSDLSDDEKIFFDGINLLRQKVDADDVIPVKELNECAEAFVSEAGKNLTAYVDGTRKDGSDWTTLLDEAGITYTNCGRTYGYTLNYDVEAIPNGIRYDNKSYNIVTNPAWKYAGFYYSPNTRFWIVLFISDDPANAVSEPNSDVYAAPGSEVNTYFDNSTAFEAFQTYMIALCNDDYNTYLAITGENNNSETVEKYDRRKECYVGMDPSDIEWWEVGRGYGLGGYGTYFDVVEYESSGSAKFDINTMGSAYGTIVVKRNSPDDTYYIAVHYNYSPFMTIDQIQ